ncbi:MAG: amino acid dehydrogenase [Chitinophagales bacterium]|nr:amino acid dehydrogenase [Chitinophagales bacterium]
MESILDKYKKKRPAVVFEWADNETNAEGWIVINSLRGGAAGGGTRMRKGLDRYEVESLAKVMEIKFTISGPLIGGAKSGINFDPADPRKRDVLKRWFKAVTPVLKEYYGTGGDLNIDEVKDVIPITEGYGLWHPQEGIVNGHFKADKTQKIKLIGQLRQGVSKKLEDPDYTPEVSKKYNVADLITGYGVAEAVKHYYEIYRNESCDGKRAVIQGWGNVAGAAGYYMAKMGAKIVGILDKAGGVINVEGMSYEQVKKLMLDRKDNSLSSDVELLSFDEANSKFWDLPAEIFIPGAASKLVTRDQIDRLISSGLEVVSAGANVPFVDDDIFFGENASHVDKNVGLIPDFIANCGMARTFAFLMDEIEVEISDKAIFDDVSETIARALRESHQKNNSRFHVAETALGIALDKLL